MDFTITIYKELLSALINQGYKFQTVSDYLQEPLEKSILLRHDVDDRKLHSLEFAKIQSQLGIQATYYFRIIPQSFDPKIILEIYNMGHEIGYHYEDMDFANGNIDEAIILFEKHLTKLRQIVPINTICMHGSPKSSYDNKDLWKKYNYKNYNIESEPYFDIDFDSIAYYTDTGRMWDGHKFSVRDKVISNSNFPTFHSTQEIIQAINKGDFPQKAMMNFHPQRWTNNLSLWYKDALLQSIKNQVKMQIIKSKK